MNNTVNMSTEESLEYLRTFAKKVLLNDSVQWQQFFFGFIETLNTVYLIARPYMGLDMGTYRVFILQHNDENAVEVEVINAFVHTSSRSLIITTNFGIFSFDRERNEQTFNEGNGSICELSEYSLLN